MSIYDIYNNKEIHIFDDSKLTTFTQMQKNNVQNIISNWVDAGFAKENGWNADSLNEVNTSFFIPYIVYGNDKISVKVDFGISMLNSNEKLMNDYFSALFIYIDGNFSLERLFYTIVY